MSDDTGVPFGSLGKPSRADAKAVWDAMPSPSIRKVVDHMQRRGWKATVSTIQRWSVDNFIEPDPGKNPKKAVDTAKKANRKAKEAVTKLTDLAPVHNSPELKEAIAFEPSQIKALVTETKESLKDKLDRLTMAVSIVALEQFALKAHALVLMPKDCGAFLGSMAEVATAMKAGEVKPGDGKDPINLTANPEKPANALSDKIAQFRKENKLAVV